MLLARRLWQFRHISWQLALRSARSLYGGSLLGLFWMVFKPLLMLLVYTLVFGVVFQSRFYQQAGPSSPVDFGLALFIGLTCFSLLSDMMGKAPGLIAGNTNFVKRVVFPLDMLVVSEFAATLLQFGVSLAIFLVFMLVRYHGLPWSALAVPVILLPFALLALGLSWLLASLGVYLRDLAQITGVVVTVMLFLSPVFFPVSALPPIAQHWMFLNPVADVVEQARAAFFLGAWPDPLILLRQYVTGILALWLGWAWFELTRKGFADVL
jgi:lipopolysaccharide transport system permease protein